MNEHWCIVDGCRHGTLNGSLALGSLYLAEYQKGYKAGFKDAEIDNCPTCIKYKGQMMPPHSASPKCESGGHNHCSCDICF
jgi:hypothetical protein